MTTEEELDDQDRRDALRIRAAIDSGAMETFSEAEMDAWLASPVAFWRQRRGLTQAALAEQVGISQAYLAQIETGKCEGTVGLYARLVEALAVQMEDIVGG